MVFSHKKVLLSGFMLAIACFPNLYEAQGAIESDRIQSLPGWNGALPTKQYSGYFAVEHGSKHLHYWFVESENNPSTDPVIAWYNGGPGCSSLMGFFTENGPFAINVTQNGPILVERPTRWNKFANVVYFESPAGVGFSYANSEAGLTTNDSETADNNYEALMKFFEGFSEYRSNQLFLTGESYAGIYVPTLAHLVLKRDNRLNLKGIMVGNGCTGNDIGVCGGYNAKYLSEFLGRKGLFSEKLYETIRKQCTDWRNRSSKCQDALRQMHQEVGAINVYNVYAPCIDTGDSASFEDPVIGKLRKTLFQTSSGYGPEPQPGPLQCINGGPSETYLNQASVRSALHVGSESTTGKWTTCTNALNYTSTQSNEPKNIYPDLINNYRVLIYNGDADGSVPYLDNEEWTSNMSIPVKSKWRPWYVDNQVAGYVTKYENDFAFLTVKGAGHMVPEFKPEQAYAMAYRFIME
eukprot:gb/GECG01009455.1/.p1 GENE.gb/GECG01009455.1/~~gb/GECG01009455.1/.p1  ORF type:complete len:465 (+),score=47.99 gb/GECG01009455.1/:1-1395(+)